MAKGIYKRGNVYWIRYAGLDGQVIRESTGSSKFKEAEGLLLKRKSSIKEGKQPDIKVIEKHTFKALSFEYIKWAERQKSFKNKVYIINQLVERFGNFPLRRFSSMIIEQYQTEKSKINKPATVNRQIATLKHMFTKAVEWDMVEEETLRKIRQVKLLTENNKRLRYLSNEECQALVNTCSPHLRPIVITALNTGMRKEEILSLEWEKHVDLKHGFITLDITKNGERRELPINQTLRNVLGGITRRLDIPFVFYDKSSGKRYLDIKRSFATACKKAGIKDFRFHDLRHTFASHLVMAGVDITTVKNLLGHKTIGMTLRYAHLAPSHMVKALDLLDSTINTNCTITAQFPSK